MGNYVKDGEVFPLDIFFYNSFKSHGFKLRNRIVWRFNFGLHSNKRLSGRYETVLWFTKSDEYKFNLDAVRIPQLYPGKRHGSKKNGGAGKLSGNPLGKNPSDFWEFSANEHFKQSGVWDIPNVKANHPEKTIHPCQFPVELAERYILAFTNIGDLVLEYLSISKKKKVLYDKINADSKAFVEFCDQHYPDFADARGDYYQPAQYNIRIVYCSLNKIEKSLKSEVPGVKYLDFEYAKYFLSVSRAIRGSAKFELLEFLGLRSGDVGEGAVTPHDGSVTYNGSVLPESHSSFRTGYKIVSFYVDPEALLSRCYVLRKDRWEDRNNLYQRMISKKKLESIRRYLLEQKRVFVNNIVLTLPEKTELLNSHGHVVDPSQLTKTAPIKIRLPTDYNSVGLIDGQHRVFAYYEGGNEEKAIKKLRQQQNLLATGIVYPEGLSVTERIKFEAKLFLEINATQTSAKSDLKQAIGLILRPFSPESIAKEVVNYLNDNTGPLLGQFEKHFYEKNKLKTTSVVSYAVRQIVKLQGTDTLFRVWKYPKKNTLADEKDAEMLREYVEFCAKQLNQFLGAVRACVPKEVWTADKKIKGRMLTTTNINGLIICMRKTLETDNVHSFEYYKTKFEQGQLSNFGFSKYKSSQYARMGTELHAKFFA